MKTLLLNFRKPALFIFSLFILSDLAFGQLEEMARLPVDPNTGLITYQEVVEEEGNPEDLFNRCIYWLNDFYKNPVAVTKKRDFASKVIKGQHQFRVYYTDEEGYKKDAGMIMYDFTIEFKQDRYRYTVSDLLVRKTSRYPVENWLNKNDPDFNPRWESYLSQIHSFFTEEWIPSLKEKMVPEEIIEEEEW